MIIKKYTLLLSKKLKISVITFFFFQYLIVLIMKYEYIKYIKYNII